MGGFGADLDAEMSAQKVMFLVLSSEVDDAIMSLRRLGTYRAAPTTIEKPLCMRVIMYRRRVHAAKTYISTRTCIVMIVARMHAPCRSSSKITQTYKHTNITRPMQVIEFYAATEGNGGLINYCAKGDKRARGAVGRMGKLLSKVMGMKLVKFDVETESPVRGPDGFCVECDVDEARPH